MDWTILAIVLLLFGALIGYIILLTREHKKVLSVQSQLWTKLLSAVQTNQNLGEKIDEAKAEIEKIKVMQHEEKTAAVLKRAPK